MRLSTLLTSGMLIIVLCFGVVGGRVLVIETGARGRASDGVAAARLAELTLTLSTWLSAERGPTNGALGADAPLPHDRRAVLDTARAATDGAFAAVERRIQGDPASAGPEITGSLASARQQLALVRQRIDHLLQLPLSQRAGDDLNGVIAGMIDVIPLLSPGLNAMEATLAQADPSLTSLITAARLATDMREFAGQLGSVFTAPIVSGRAMTTDEGARLERITGHLDALAQQFRLSYAKLEHDPAMDAEIAEIDTHFFGAGRRFVQRMAEIGRTTGDFGMSAAEFAGIYVPEMKSLVVLRDAAVARLKNRIDAVLVSRNQALALNGLAIILELGVLACLYWTMRRRVSLPVLALTEVIDRLARRDYDVAVPGRTRKDEIGRMANAIDSLRRAAIAAEATEAQIVHLARHDALTGLPNRTLLQERMDQALALVGRGQQVAALCLDLDRFKDVNDTFGHPVGDLLLIAVAERMTACVREVDTVSRLGGDEFVVLLFGLESPDYAGVLAARIVRTLCAPFELDGQTISVGASVGIAIAPQDSTSPVGLLKRADTALYRAKLDEPGSYRYFEPEMHARLQARAALEFDLRSGVRDGAFELAYQPQILLATGALTGFEALLRWRHPARGLIAPGEFIALAEETNLITPIGAWVLRQACAEALKWPVNVKVAVNLSAVQFRGAGPLQAVQQALVDTGLPPSRLDLEITESVLLNTNSATLAMLHDLHALGVGISMDDFGTGYSSLSYLRSFPFDKIKIDQSFVRDLSEQVESQAIISAVVAVADSLGMTTTAEGVETQEQLDLLRRAGCTEAQGYLFSRPIPADQVAQYVAAQTGVAHQAA